MLACVPANSMIQSTLGSPALVSRAITVTPGIVRSIRMASGSNGQSSFTISLLFTTTVDLADPVNLAGQHELLDAAVWCAGHELGEGVALEVVGLAHPAVSEYRHRQSASPQARARKAPFG